MVNRIFLNKLLEISLNNSLPKKKQVEASEIYLNNNSTLLYKRENSFSYYLDNRMIKVEYINNSLKFYCDDEEVDIDEYILACILLYKKEYYIDNEIKFNPNDIHLSNYYFNSLFVTTIYYDDYQYRFNFYYGLIDSLYILNMEKECIEMMVDFFTFLDSRISYDKKYLENEKINLFKIIKDKYLFIGKNSDILLDILKSKECLPTSFGKFIYMCVINAPLMLQNIELKKIYEFILESFNNAAKSTQFYFDLNIQYKIIKWFNKELNDDFMKTNIKSYEVMFCYVIYLYNNSMFNEICNIFNNYKFTIINNDIMRKIIYSYYVYNKYDKAINIFKMIKVMSYDYYLSFKSDFPNMFINKYLDTIIEHIIEICDYNDALNILILENKKDYELLLIAKNNFNSINDHFNEYIGIYDKQLIKIYQKEIINDFNRLKGYYNHIPELIVEKFEKLKKLNNGKYYICEVISFMLDDSYLSYSDELQEYCRGLEV